MQDPIDTIITAVPQYVLRRLAQRALRVLERHGATHEVLAAIEESFRLVAEAFIKAYDQARTSKPHKALELRQGRVATKVLHTTLRSWLGWLARDFDDFDGSAFSSEPSTPDDVIADGERMVDFVARHEATTGEKLPYADKLIAEVSQALGAARKEWTEAQDAMVAHQELQAQVRALAGELQQNLVALRRTLRTVLGTSHKDYQKLRLAKTSHLDEEDPEVVDGDGQPGDPIPAPDPTEPTADGSPSDDEAAAE
jgi:hypothetical protein